MPAEITLQGMLTAGLDLEDIYEQRRIFSKNKDEEIHFMRMLNKNTK